MVDIRNIRTRWINLDADEDKAFMMRGLLSRLDFVDQDRFPGIKDENGTAGCGESHCKLLEQTIIKDGKPILILEDDVDLGTFKPYLAFPEDAECVYLGTSHGDLRYSADPQGPYWFRIKEVFATHAILHIDPDYAQDMVDITRKWIAVGRPFDVGLARELQTKRKVYALREPMFYQSDAKNEKNKWEVTTRTPLVAQSFDE